MAPRQTCRHERARPHSVQKLGKPALCLAGKPALCLAGKLPAVELWHCPACKSTLSAEQLGRRKRPVAAA